MKKTVFIVIFFLGFSSYLICQHSERSEWQRVTVFSSLKDYKKTILSSDVDTGIVDLSNKVVENRYALIIGNEDYKTYQKGLDNENNVDYACNDARAFANYANKLLKVKKDNIFLLLNAKSYEINQTLREIKLLTNISNEKAEFIFYYAGHGLPEESTNIPYIVPVDISGATIHYGGIKLTALFDSINNFNIKRATLFIDACFSGGGRNECIHKARITKVKPKEIFVRDKLIVFSSSTGRQESHAYSEKKHGMFTYFLLKNLKKSKGQILFSELDENLSSQVYETCLRVNHKEQNPMVDAGKEVINEWMNWHF